MKRQARLARDAEVMAQRTGNRAAVDPIFFYHPSGNHGWMSNFSLHQVTLCAPYGDPLVSDVVRYATGEHRYQAMKARNREDHDWVAAAASPLEAKERGRKVTLRDGWEPDYGALPYLVMVELVTAKAIQNALVHRLRDTDHAVLYEDSPTDDIWGWRYQEDYSGKNLLGRAWMRARWHLGYGR